MQAKYLRRDVRAVEKARVQIWRGVVSAGNRGDQRVQTPGTERGRLPRQAIEFRALRKPRETQC